MGTKKQNGFTIIEVMLFLAVTGVLAVGILVGSGVAIGQQRYRDSVNSLRSYIQQQYSETANVVNGRDKVWNCDSAGNVTEADATAGQARGTSNCVILGRFVTVDATGTKLTASNITGFRTPGATTASSDIDEIITNYKLGISPIDQDTQEVSWGAQVVKPKSTDPMPFSMLIIRSPLSGSVLTFSAPGLQTDPEVLVSDTEVAKANMNTQQDLCVNADVGSFVGGRMEVRINKFASSQSAIQVPAESDSVCN
ncbi:MAG TPA: prepilin-type N-terminal cleavage/methylation domain-containing protein [Candidatus Saccharimonadales bacterium]|nr:prepilin-type N-terminal cleavage/methylation domain-containing protein [Candidatus Saccharimonadales bacterium]